MIRASIYTLITVSAFAAHTPYHVSCPEFPTLRHEEYPEDHAENVTFDEALHLAIEEPK
jgi:hypothetical protein